MTREGAVLWFPKTTRVMRSETSYSVTTQALTMERSLLLDETRVSNAVDVVGWGDALMQLEICGHCGTPGCNPGNYVAPRRAGDWVLWLPAFAELTSIDDKGAEYAPPEYLFRKGVPTLSVAQIEDLAIDVRAARELLNSPALSGAESLRLVQWTAPSQVLGALGAPVALQRREDVLGVSSGDSDQGVDDLGKALTRLEAAQRVVLESRPPDSEATIFYLDDACYSSWSAFCRGQAGGVMLGDDWILRPAA